jgi:hypothetical protein
MGRLKPCSKPIRLDIDNCQHETDQLIPSMSEIVIPEEITEAGQDARGR